MTAIEVNFLTGRYSATAHHDREQAEWPPHGARLFSALVAAWADAEQLDEAERAVLEWLEAQPPPRITAPEAVCRQVVSHYVPVNDVSVVPRAQYLKRACDLEMLLRRYDDEIQAVGGMSKKAESLEVRISKVRDVSTLAGKVGNASPDSAVALLPDRTGAKKERYFPSVTLVEPDAPDSRAAEARAAVPVRLPSVIYAWDDAVSPETAQALDGLLRRVTRLGHSSSLVSCRLRDEAPEATHIPGEGAEMLRWVRPGQLSALQAEHRRHQGVRTRSLPFNGVRYRRNESAEADSSEPLRPASAGDWIVFELEPRDRRLPLTRTVELTRVLRESVLSHVPDPLPEGVSGHLPDGKPTALPHISFLTLPNVGFEHSDGRVMGLAVSLPPGLDDAALDATLRGIGSWERNRGGRPLQLRMGRSGAVEMRRKQPPFALVSLRPETWAKPSRWWTSATSVALPAHPGDLRRGSAAARARAWARAEDAVVKSCVHVGLPRPLDVRVSLAPLLVGSRPARDFPVFRQGQSANGGVVRRLVHAAVEFGHPVAGPLVLGSGRFIGLGLMRPVDEADADGAVASGRGGNE